MPNLGDEIVVSAVAPAEYRPGSTGWIVALALPERDLVTVEFEDGSSLEVPTSFIAQA